jgi:membrane fusion protein (multidrug efflux system)
MSIIKKAIRGGWERITSIGIVAGIAVLICVGIYIVRAMSRESTDDAFITGHIVSVSARVDGHVNRVDINDNQWVNEGDALVKIDPNDYQAKFELAQAAEAQAQAQAGMAAVEAERTEKDFKRYQQLYDANAGVTQQQLDNASAAAKSAKAQLDSANSRVAEAKASLEQARLNLSYTDVRAPQSGTITKKNIEAGEYIRTGQPLLAIVPPEIWVVANFKETQLKHMKPGQQVAIKVDAFSGKTFKGHVDSIQAGTGSVFSLLPPENATGNYIKVVQRVPVKIVFDEDPNDMKTLSPGMSVIPVVKVK